MYEATSPIRWCRSDGTTFYVAEQRGRLTALDPATGTPRWRFPSDGHFHSGDLAFSDGAEQIYLSTSTGIGYYLDAMTGRVRWRHDYRDTPYGFHTAGDPPPPEGRSLVSGWHVAIRNGAEVHALDTKNGRKRWRFSPAGHEPHFPPIGDVERISTAGGLLLAEYRHSLHAIDIRSGNPAWSHWSFARQGYLYSWTLGGTVLVYDRSRELLALDLRTGQELWHFPCRLDGRGQVTPGRDTLFVLEENEIQRVDPATGRRTWRWSPPSQTRTLGVSAIEDDLIHVWLHGYGDTLNALRISSKELMWSHEAVRHAGVIYSNEAMYFWDPNSSLLRSVGREDGRKKWEIQVGDPDSDDTRSAVGKPVIAGNVIACQSDSHRLCGVGPAY
jgi:outer membrane protein assembly factor BamB